MRERNAKCPPPHLEYHRHPAASPRPPARVPRHPPTPARRLDTYAIILLPLFLLFGLVLPLRTRPRNRNCRPRNRNRARNRARSRNLIVIALGLATACAIIAFGIAFRIVSLVIVIVAVVLHRGRPHIRRLSTACTLRYLPAPFYSDALLYVSAPTTRQPPNLWGHLQGSLLQRLREARQHVERGEKAEVRADEELLMALGGGGPVGWCRW